MANNDYVYDVAKPYKSAYSINSTIQIFSTKETIDKGERGDTGHTYEFNSPKLQVFTPNRTIEISQNSVGEGEASLLLDSVGTYRINYSGSIYKYDIINGFLVGRNNYSISFYFSVVENKLPLKKWSVTDVVNRLCDLAEPIRKGEAPRFRFNAEQAAQFDKVLSPQFSFTKETLRECLQEVGNFLHGQMQLIPKKDEDGVWYYEVNYEMYASQEESGIWTRPYIDKTVSQGVLQYTSYLRYIAFATSQFNERGNPLLSLRVRFGRTAPYHKII